MKTYAVHSKLVDTQDKSDMLAIYPTPAEYGDFYLFAQTHPNPAQPVIDMQSIEGLQEFDAAYLQLLSEEHQGRWVHISEAQGRFLLGKYFTPVEEETV